MNRSEGSAVIRIMLLAAVPRRIDLTA